MANLLSPGVQVSEVDQSQITPTEGDSAAVFGGDFEKGPVGVHTLISNVQELRDNYGKPNTKNYNDYYQVQNFLAYSGAIYVSRAADLNGTPTQLDGLLFEENAYKTNVNATKVEGVKVIESDSVDVKFEKIFGRPLKSVVNFSLYFNTVLSINKKSPSTSKSPFIYASPNAKVVLVSISFLGIGFFKIILNKGSFSPTLTSSSSQNFTQNDSSLKVCKKDFKNILSTFIIFLRIHYYVNFIKYSYYLHLFVKYSFNLLTFIQNFLLNPSFLYHLHLHYQYLNKLTF